MLIAPADLAAVEQTLDVLSDPAALAEIRQAEAEASRGDFTSAEAMARLMAGRRRSERGGA